MAIAVLKPFWQNGELLMRGDIGAGGVSVFKPFMRETELLWRGACADNSIVIAKPFMRGNNLYARCEAACGSPFVCCCIDGTFQPVTGSDHTDAISNCNALGGYSYGDFTGSADAHSCDWGLGLSTDCLTAISCDNPPCDGSSAGNGGQFFKVDVNITGRLVYQSSNRILNATCKQCEWDLSIYSGTYWFCCIGGLTGRIESGGVFYPSKPNDCTFVCLCDDPGGSGSIVPVNYAAWYDGFSVGLSFDNCSLYVAITSDNFTQSQCSEVLCAAMNLPSQVVWYAVLDTTPPGAAWATSSPNIETSLYGAGTVSGDGRINNGGLSACPDYVEVSNMTCSMHVEQTLAAPTNVWLPDGCA